MGTTKLAVPVGPSFTAWYQSTASQAFGSQFTVTLPLTLEGDLVTVHPTLTAAVQSASVTLINNQGASSVPDGVSRNAFPASGPESDAAPPGKALSEVEFRRDLHDARIAGGCQPSERGALGQVFG